MNIAEIGKGIELVGSFPVSKLDVKHMKNVMTLHKELEHAKDQYFELQKKIFTENNIEPTEEGQYQWKGHKNEEAISAKIKELFNDEIHIGSGNFLSEDEFFNSAKSFNVSEVSFLHDLMVTNTTSSDEKQTEK